MSTLALSFDNYNVSVFDQIRKVDDNGSEFWSARELMPVLGYTRWSDFKPVIDRAMIASENIGNPITEHFSGSILKSIGRPSEDFKLSRYAAYLTSLNGDPRKPEIAAAQNYFVVKTRQAETSQVSLEPLYQLIMDLTVRNQKLEQEFSELRKELTEVNQLKNDTKRLTASKNIKAPKSTVDPIKDKIFTDLVKACKGEPKKIADFRTHSLGRRKDVLGVYGIHNERKQTYLLKSGIVAMFSDATKHGYGTFNDYKSLFTPVSTQSDFEKP